MAFSITLAPPEPEKSDPPPDETKDAKAKREAAEKKAKAERMAASDTVGNLDADGGAAWALPMSEEGRSSLIRRHVQVNVGPAEPEDGTMMENLGARIRYEFRTTDAYSHANLLRCDERCRNTWLPCRWCVAC